MDTKHVAHLLEALGNETRLGIYRLLVVAGRGGLPVGELQRELAIPGSTLSHHLAKLVQAGLVHQARESRVLRCTVDFERMEGILRFMTEQCCARDCGG